MSGKTNIIYISWQPSCSRSDNTARELGGESYLVYYDFLGSHYGTIAIKYFLQSLKTLALLLRKRPRTVFVMSPPLFAAVPVFVYCKLFRKNYVVDAHTGAFFDPLWQKVMFLQKFFCRKARFTIVTNPKLGDIVDSWGGRHLVIPDVPVQYPEPSKPGFEAETNIVLVNSFAPDEPLEEFLQAADQFPGIQFHVTGKVNGQVKKIVESAPSNVTFTGFLPDDLYHGLLLAADAVAVLTTRNHTMQRGAYEAVYLGRPVITSDWPVLRHNFPYGTVFVDNSVEGITQGIQAAMEDLPGLKQEAERLKQWKLKNWQDRKSSIQAMI